MSPEIINRIRALGFRVYMRNPSDSWLIYTDGANLGYFQASDYRGYNICTVHRPNHDCGTGYKMADNLAQFNETDLRKGFYMAPEWAFSGNNRIHKYRGIEDYRKQDGFNAAYHEIVPVEAQA